MRFALLFPVLTGCAFATNTECIGDPNDCVGTKNGRSVSHQAELIKKAKQLVIEINFGAHPDHSVPLDCKLAFFRERAEEASLRPNNRTTRQREAEIFPQRFYLEPVRTLPDPEYIREQCPQYVLGQRCAVLSDGGVPFEFMDVGKTPLEDPRVFICQCEKLPLWDRCAQRFLVDPQHYIDFVWESCKAIDM